MLCNQRIRQWNKREINVGFRILPHCCAIVDPTINSCSAKLLRVCTTTITSIRAKEITCIIAKNLCFLSVSLSLPLSLPLVCSSFRVRSLSFLSCTQLRGRNSVNFVHRISRNHTYSVICSELNTLPGNYDLF